MCNQISNLVVLALKAILINFMFVQVESAFAFEPQQASNKNPAKGCEAFSLNFPRSEAIIWWLACKLIKKNLNAGRREWKIISIKFVSEAANWGQRAMKNYR